MIDMNEIYVISPCKHHGIWVFDDARVGLSQEPFVAGADTWIDRVVADIPNAETDPKPPCYAYAAAALEVMPTNGVR